MVWEEAVSRATSVSYPMCSPLEWFGGQLAMGREHASPEQAD